MVVVVLSLGTVFWLLPLIVGYIRGNQRGWPRAGLLFALFLSWVGVLLIRFLPNRGPRELSPRCPECRERVRADATRCPHCHQPIISPQAFGFRDF